MDLHRDINELYDVPASDGISLASCGDGADFPLVIRRLDHSGAVPLFADACNVVFVAAGKGVHQILPLNDKAVATSAAAYGIMQGDLFGVSHDERHVCPWQDKLSVFNLQFSPSLLSSTELSMLEGLPGLGVLMKPGRQRPRVKIHLTRQLRHAVECLLTKAIEELALCKPGYRVKARACLLELLVLVGRALPREWKPNVRVADAQNIQQSIHRSIAYMEARITAPITLAELADQANLNQTYFSEQFKLTAGVSPWNYLIQLRLEKVKELLADTELPIAEIATRSGFCDSSYLAKTFRLREGMTPRAFRQKLTGQEV